MKRNIVLLVCFVMCVICHAQKKLFAAALDAGRQPHGCYILHNSKNKNLKKEKLIEYAQNNGYIVGEITEKDISLFGDVAQSVSTMQFLPKSEYESYIYCNIFPSKNVDLTKNQTHGSAFYFTGWDIGTFTIFKRANDIKWNGEVADGMLEGEGLGYFTDDNRRFIFIEGVFEHGFPIGNTKTTIYDFGGNYGLFKKENVDEKSFSIGKMYDGMAMIERDGFYGFVDNEGRLAIKPKYQKVIQQFADGKAVVIINGKESIIDSKGSFVDYTQHQKQLDEEVQKNFFLGKKEYDAKKY